jgi:hypothetical protein
MIREKKKRYNEKNKENIAEYHKEYRKNHKETISGKRTKKEQCICGITFTRCHKARHMKTNKHQSYINSIEFYQDVYDMVKSIVKKIPKNI